MSFRTAHTSPVSSLARSRWPTTRSSGRRATRERRRADQSQTAAGGPSGKPTPRNRLRATGVVQCIRVARWHVCRPRVSEPHRPLTPSSAAMRAYHPSHLVGGTFSGTARAMPRARTVARQRRGRCLPDTDLMTRSPLSEASIGVAASPSATSIRAPTSGLSRSSGESRATVRTTLPLPRRIDVGSGSSGPRCKSTSSHRGREQPTTRSRRRRGTSARTQSPRSCSCHKPFEPRRETVPPTSPDSHGSGIASPARTWR